ncbi:odorant-binding protein-like [Hipposideros larvatus]
MKTLLLTLLLGVACADLGTVDLSTLSGEWKTLYLASSNIAKISETGPFRVFMRKVEFDSNPDTVLFNFFVKDNGKCVEYFDIGRKVQKNIYITGYSGKTELKISYASDNAFVLCALNVAENGSVTRLTGLFGKENYANEEDFEKFKEFTRDYRIPEENIVDIISLDTCPTS